MSSESAGIMSPFFLAYNVLASGSVVHGVLSSLLPSRAVI
jgi:hypothetical protein